MATLLSLRDNFNDNSLDSSKWTAWSGAGASVSEASGQIECTVDAVTNGSNSQIYSATTYDITDKYLYINLVQAAQSYVDTFFAVKTSGGDRAGFVWEGGNIVAYTSISGIDDYRLTAAVTPGSSLWLRIRVDGSTFYWDYSTDAQGSWTTLDSEAVSSLFSVSAVTIEFGVYKWSATSTSQTKTIFDTFNSFDLSVSVDDLVGIADDISSRASVDIPVHDEVDIEEGLTTRVDISSFIFDLVDTDEDIAIVITELNVSVSVSDNIPIDEYVTWQIEVILYIDLSQESPTVYVYYDE